mmetsp:Transcript_8854/g.21096  ORF Transcript_8854/g.21096 Transcript_8854/m.21096 type:complete len:344 (-) Transcript_8854:37-1068(-)
MPVQHDLVIGCRPTDIFLRFRINLPGNVEQTRVEDNLIGGGLIHGLGRGKTNFVEEGISVYRFIGGIKSPYRNGSNHDGARWRWRCALAFSAFVFVVPKRRCAVFSIHHGVRHHPCHVGRCSVGDYRMPLLVASNLGVFVDRSSQHTHFGSLIDNVIVFVGLDPLRRGKVSEQGWLVGGQHRSPGRRRRHQGFALPVRRSNPAGRKDRPGGLRGRGCSHVIQVVVAPVGARNPRSRPVCVSGIQDDVCGGGHPHRELCRFAGPVGGKLDVNVDTGFLGNLLGGSHDVVGDGFDNGSGGARAAGGSWCSGNAVVIEDAAGPAHQVLQRAGAANGGVAASVDGRL